MCQVWLALSFEAPETVASRKQKVQNGEAEPACERRTWPQLLCAYEKTYGPGRITMTPYMLYSHKQDRYERQSRRQVWHIVPRWTFRPGQKRLHSTPLHSISPFPHLTLYTHQNVHLPGYHMLCTLIHPIGPDLSIPHSACPLRNPPHTGTPCGVPVSPLLLSHKNQRS